MTFCVCFLRFWRHFLRFARKRKKCFLRFGRDLPQNAKIIFCVLELKFAVFERRGARGLCPQFLMHLPLQASPPNQTYYSKRKIWAPKRKICCVDTSHKNANFAFETKNVKKQFSCKKRKICVLRGHPISRRFLWLGELVKWRGPWTWHFFVSSLAPACCHHNIIIRSMQEASKYMVVLSLHCIVSTSY